MEAANLVGRSRLQPGFSMIWIHPRIRDRIYEPEHLALKGRHIVAQGNALGIRSKRIIQAL